MRIYYSNGNRSLIAYRFSLFIILTAATIISVIILATTVSTTRTTMATEPVQTSEAIKLVLRTGQALKQKVISSDQQIKLLKDGVKSYKKLIRARDAFDDSAHLLFEYLATIVGRLKSSQYNMRWLLKEIGMPESTGYRKSKELAIKIEDSGLTHDQYLQKLENDINNGVATFKKEKVKIKKQLQFKTDDSVALFIDTQAEIYAIEQSQKKEKEDKAKAREDDRKAEQLQKLGKTIKLLKRKSESYPELKPIVVELEKQLIRVLNDLESGLPFDADTPGTTEYKS